MLRKTLAIIIAVIIIVAAVSAVAYTQFIAPSGEAREIKIGLVAPISGSPIGTDMKRAAELAVQEINDAGGIYVSIWRTHVNISLVYVNTIDDSPSNALNAMTQSWNTNPVDLFIGGYGSAGTLADEKVAMDNRVPFIITGASNNLVTRRGPQGDYGGYGSSGIYSTADSVGMSYMFHYCTTTYDYAKTVVDFFSETMKPMVAPSRNFSLALLYRYDAFGQGVAAATKYWIQTEDLPITIVAEEHYTPGSSSEQATALAGIKAANPDAVFIAENPDKSPGLIDVGWNTVGLKTVYVSVENNQDPQFYSLLEQYGSMADGQLMESKMDPFMVPSYSTIVGDYSSKFNATYGVMPGMMGADTYDAFYIAKAAIESAGTVDKAAVRDAIETISIDQSLVLMENGKIQFSTGNESTSSIGISYHEIKPVTFMEQLKYNSTTGKLQSVIIWPSSAGSISNFNQTTFTLPTGYVAGS